MIKIDIISGFLGAGKTTFIKKMLDEAFQDEKIALIENEFGEVGIDGGFLKDSGVNVTEMNSGCICCSLVGDFGKNLNEVIEKYRPDRIVIEPSGVGKLSDVMQSVLDIEKDKDVALNALVTVVNAKKAAKQMKAFGEFFNNQIEYAATIALTRTQDMDAKQLELCVKQMRELNPKAAIITTPQDQISGEQILKVIEGQDLLSVKMLEEARRREQAEHESCGHESHEHAECDGHGHGDGCGHESHEHAECDGHGHGDGCGHESHEHADHDGHGHGDGCGHESHEHADHDGHGHEDGCDCGHHGRGHHHHHADDIFTSWGKETPHKFTKGNIEEALRALSESDEYGEVLRAKGMVENEAGGWIYFDMVPGEYELREGEPDYTGRLCVIGTGLNERGLEDLFEIS